MVIDSNNDSVHEDTSTIITMTNMDDNDQYELIIPDVCTYFKVRFPDVNQLRVKKNMLIGMEYFNSHNSAEELRNILAFASYHNGHLIAKAEFNIQSDVAILTHLQIAKKSVKAIHVFFNLIMLYLFDTLKKTTIKSMTTMKKRHIFCHTLFENKDNQLVITKQAFVKWLIPAYMPIPIQYDELIAKNECTHVMTKHYYSLKESIGICERLKGLNIQYHVNKKSTHF